MRKTPRRRSARIATIPVYGVSSRQTHASVPGKNDGYRCQRPHCIRVSRIPLPFIPRRRSRRVETMPVQGASPRQVHACAWQETPCSAASARTAFGCRAFLSDPSGRDYNPLVPFREGQKEDGDNPITHGTGRLSSRGGCAGIRGGSPWRSWCRCGSPRRAPSP
jgi:hypothetical protein